MKQTAKRIFLILISVFLIICIAGMPLLTYAVNSETAIKEKEITEQSSFLTDKSFPTIFKQNGKSYKLYPVKITVDITGDNKCTAADARKILRFSAKIEKYKGNSSSIDISGDGKITSLDARLLLRYVAKLDRYFADENGKPLSGFVKNAENNTCYFDQSGMLVTGLKTIDGKLYHFGNDGVMSTGIVRVSGALYCFDKNGNTVADGKTTINGKLYFFENGKARTGLIKDGNYYYYINNNYETATGIVEVNGQKYLFGKDGKGSPYTPVPSDFKTAMIGDSIVASLDLANVTEDIDFYGKVSLNTYSIFNKKISGSSRVVIDEIKDRGYDKVIILLGINEYTADTNAWINQYRNVINAVKSRVPKADIYAHAIMPVNEQRARANGYSVTNSVINEKNAALKKLAEKEGIIYLDPRSAIADSNGSLPYEASSDGIHFGVTYSKKWSNYALKEICK